MPASLHSRFSHPHVTFSRHDQLEMIDIRNAFGSARLTPYGGTVLSYVPQGGIDTLWVSETAVYDGSKPVRGGVPVCWPWFGAYDPSAMGAHPSDSNKKAHGFARYADWEVESVSDQPGGATQVVLSLAPSEAIAAVWPYDFKLQLAVTLGESLQLELIAENRSRQDWVVSEALHTYFRVAEAEGLTLRGLEGVRYQDKLRDSAVATQDGVLRIAPPLDCVYLDHPGTVVIEDDGNQRAIELRKQNSHSTIVWNPGAEGVKAFADMPDDQYHAMLCVEAGNALDNAYRLKAGETHRLGMSIATRPL
ncbi:MAG: D-hexose-6-phosphate mutarotase [Gammaproteobacteria bacterium]